MRRELPGCLAALLILSVAAFFIIAEVARGVTWIKWAFS